MCRVLGNGKIYLSRAPIRRDRVACRLCHCTAHPGMDLPCNLPSRIFRISGETLPGIASFDVVQRLECK